jgi:hypothetical protein
LLRFARNDTWNNVELLTVKEKRPTRQIAEEIFAEVPHFAMWENSLLGNPTQIQGA